MTDSPVGYRPEPGEETASDARRRYQPSVDTAFSDADGPPPAQGEYDTTYYDPADVEQDLGKLRPDDAERTSWGYIASLGIVFVFLSIAAWACDDSAEVVPELQVEDNGESVGVSTPIRLSVNVLGDIATVSGSVPDDEAKAEVLAAAESVYAAENVIDQIGVDPASVNDGGTVLVTGQALSDDERPEALQAALMDSLDLDDGGIEVERSDSTLLPATVQGAVSPVQGSPGAVRVVMTGEVPDEESRSQLQEAAAAAWGAGSVDLSAVTVAERTWDQAQIRVSGTVSAGDARHLAFPEQVSSRLGQAIIVDVSGVQVDENAVTMEDVEEQIAVKLEAEPILFAPESSDIDSSSDGLVAEIADLLKTVPTVSVEVVGHTDDVGPEDENLALSQSRADAVVARLVELGIESDRLNARGEGEAQPLVPNEDAESRSQNRRIEFNLIRAS